LKLILGVEVAYFEQDRLDFGQLRARVEAILDPMLAKYGNDFAVGCRRGFDDAARVAALAEADYISQVSWMDQLERYKAKGNAIRRHIRRHNDPAEHGRCNPYTEGQAPRVHSSFRPVHLPSADHL
jgi:hypothetical protein